ncbi:MAG: DUF2330 domain-containing protein [Myxococcota bacterium]
MTPGGWPCSHRCSPRSPSRRPQTPAAGFFCDRNNPVDQSGEDIVFSVDDVADTTTAHIQIAYEGAAEEFAWILPVATEPHVLLSTDRLFQELDWRTRTQFQLDVVERWHCTGSRGYGYGYDAAGVADTGSTFSSSSNGGGVQVVSQDQVGPYDTVVLRARSATELLDWLQANDYSLPDTLDAVLTPYIAEESYFVALKLHKDTDVGALQPVAIQYPGQGVSIPIQLTSVAATPDMRLHVYVAGKSRAVPDSYLHVTVNDLVVDWFSRGANYDDAITVAADEAGGQAFATDYSGSSDIMKDVLFRPGQFDIQALASAPDAYAFFDELLRQGFIGDAQLLALFRQYLPAPAGVDEQDFYNCLRCYQPQVDQIPFDAPAFAAAIDEAIVTPLRDAQQMLDRNPHLSRLTSSVSPHEMTVDPTFVFNPDMDQDISNTRGATLEMLCGMGGEWSSAPRRLVLADGRAYDLPSEDWFRDAGTTEYEYLSELMSHYALVIEDTSSSGQGVVLADFTQEAFDEAAAFNERQADAEAKGCGCSTGGVAGSVALLPLVGLVLRRRRNG